MRIDHPKSRLILSSFSDEEAARVVVRQLLEERLIACGTLVPGARSLYWWQGKIEESGEVLTLLKTEAETTARCMDRLAELHPYQVPEIILINPLDVSTPYSAWVNESLKE